jgi:hypothetical protein
MRGGMGLIGMLHPATPVACFDALQACATVCV